MLLSSFCLYQVEFTIGKRATNGYDPEKRLEDNLTTTSFVKIHRRAWMFNSDL